jgi:lipopolysaccharide biosynthesis protein
MINREPLVVALYLPQYYETEYNNEWWEKGFTEWMACRRAKPLFEGHNQPRVPLNQNYYDLSIKENIRWQMELAKEYGIDGFAIYLYYSCGSKTT